MSLHMLILCLQQNIKKLEAAIEARKAAKANVAVESVGDLARDPQVS
jgi:cell division protein FtsL